MGLASTRVYTVTAGDGVTLHSDYSDISSALVSIRYSEYSFTSISIPYSFKMT